MSPSILLSAHGLIRVKRVVSISGGCKERLSDRARILKCFAEKFGGGEIWGIKQISFLCFILFLCHLCRSLSGYLASHSGGNIFPIDQIIQEVLDIYRALISEINVIGMLPYITAKQGCLAKAKRVNPIFCFGNGKVA